MPAEDLETAMTVIGIVVCAILGVTIGFSANRMMPGDRGHDATRGEGSGPSNAHGWWDCRAREPRCDDGYRSINGSTCQPIRVSSRNQIR
jgi:hypothetical protein